MVLSLDGRFIAMVGEFGVMAYHPFGKAHDILDEITKIRKRIPMENKKEMQEND